VTGFLVLLCVLALVLINVPIAVALSIAAVVAMLATQGVASLPNVPLALYQGATSFPLIAIPLFILAAAIMNTSGISHRLIDFCQALVGWMRGALAQVNVLSHMFFAEISGSAVAGVAATGGIIIPAMKERGYPGPFSAAVTSSTATLAIILPPSIPMILYAVMAGASVVQMFVAGIVPGLLASFGFMALCHWYAVRHNWPVEQIFQWGALWRAFRHAFWALTLPVIILGGIFGGIVTATEGAALAVVASLLVGGLVYRELDWARLRDAVIEGAVQTGTVMLLVASSALLGLYLTEVQLPQRIAAAMLSVTNEKWAILAILNIFFLIIGMFLHSAAAIVLVVPIVMPVVLAAGIDPIHFGVIVTLNLAIGQQTPPVASVLLLTCSIAKESVWDVTKANIPFIVVLLVTLLLITYVPVVTLGLIDVFYR
jgi:tripartite ATP-independent transporter DctM subunit